MISQKLVQRELNRKGDVRFGRLDPKFVADILDKARANAYDTYGILWELRNIPQSNWLGQELKPISLTLEKMARTLHFLKQKMDKQTDFYF